MVTSLLAGSFSSTVNMITMPLRLDTLDTMVAGYSLVADTSYRILIHIIHWWSVILYHLMVARGAVHYVVMKIFTHLPELLGQCMKVSTLL